MTSVVQHWRPATTRHHQRQREVYCIELEMKVHERNRRFVKGQAVRKETGSLRREIEA